MLRRPGSPVPVAIAVATVAALCWPPNAPSAATAGAPTSAPRQPAWAWALPQGFPPPPVPAANPMSRGKVAIGRRLFYDERLSGSGTQSCGSCHRPELAFTDGRARAVGATGEPHPRNTPSIVNVAYRSTLTWANPALVSLERQLEAPLFGSHPVELGVTAANRGRVLRRIGGDRWYAARFRRAFPTLEAPLTWRTVGDSIAAFERSIVSASSRFDRYRRGEARLSAVERRGLRVFGSEQAGCARCHGSFLFDDQATFAGAPRGPRPFHNIGLYNLAGSGAYPAPNRGIFEVTGRWRDMGRFRAPSLRNVALTAPYMHDGSVATLREAVDVHLAGGRVLVAGPHAGDGRASPYRDPLLAPTELGEADRAAIVAFLATLTERDFSRDPRFSDPLGRRRR